MDGRNVYGWSLLPSIARTIQGLVAFGRYTNKLLVSVLRTPSICHMVAKLDFYCAGDNIYVENILIIHISFNRIYYSSIWKEIINKI